MFDTLSSHIVGWTPDVPPLTRARTVATVANHFYLGLALARTAVGPRLYAADGAGGIDVFGGQFRLLPRPHAFRDPRLPSGLGPYNVAVLEGRVYVAYAPVPGATASVDGVIDVFDHDGRMIRRLATGGVLHDPWGMVLVPVHWGRFGRMLLVGNEGTGASTPSTRRPRQGAVHPPPPASAPQRYAPGRRTDWGKRNRSWASYCFLTACSRG